VGYYVIATFIVEDETIDSICEALQHLSSEHPDWSPASFMVDNAESEIKAIQAVFPGIYWRYLLVLKIFSEKGWEENKK